MTLRLPGSLVNRALRSRLLSAQKYRATSAAQQLPQTWAILNNTRSASSYSDRSSGWNGNRRPERPEGPERSERPERRQHPDKRGRNHLQNKKGERRIYQDAKTAESRDLLMAIASGSPTAQYNNESEIAESEALDNELPESDAEDSKGPEIEVLEDENSEGKGTERDTGDGKTVETGRYRGPPQGGSKITPKIVNMELKWLNDPRVMADRIARILHSGDPALAAAIVRAGTKQGMRCDVAWNHILQYCMDQKNPQAAFKFYNDMKKRGRRPSARTYTIMLKGFSAAPKSLALVKTAASVYRSIASPNSGVKLGIIHTNAMLTVCHRHGDMDRLWKIAGELPEEGPGAPDATTYTIILNAVQFAARRDIQEMSPDQIETILERKSQAITEGKRIWADVIYRWKNQTLEIDNDLVNGMASLLLDGASDIDCYNVMELYKQTMGIPILQKRPTENSKTTRRRITHEENQSIEVSESKRQEAMEDLPFVDENNQPLEDMKSAEQAEQVDPFAEEGLEEVEEEEEESFEDLFKPVVPEAEELSFLRPSSKELTLLLNACFTMTQGTDGGLSYWKHMTMEDTHYRIEPDTFTYIQYFRLLRISRSSKISVKTMREQMVPSGQATGTAFHVALSVCRRDRRNHSVLLHANELISLMDKALILPDIRVLDGYLETIQILSANPSVLLNLRGLGTDEDSKARRLQDLGRKLQAKLRLTALSTLRPYVAQLHEAMENGKPEPKSRWSALQNQLSDAASGSATVKFMSRVRLIVDDTLKPDYKTFVSKTERKTLEAESQMLKKYSDKQVIENFKKKTVYPTSDQKKEAKQRIAKYQEEFRLEKTAQSDPPSSDPKVDSLQHEAKTQAKAEA